MRTRAIICLAVMAVAIAAAHAQQKAKKGKAAGKAAAANAENSKDARNVPTDKPPQPRDPEFAHFGIFEQSAPRPTAAAPMATSLPLDLRPGDHIGFIGNTLFERAQLFGHIEALLHERF